MLEIINILVKNAIVVAVWGSIAGFAFLAVPRSFLQSLRSKYKCFKFENNGLFYDKYLKISKWKDKMPKFSAIMHKGFNMEAVERISPEYLDLFIDETIRSEFCHIFLVLSSPIFYLVNDSLRWGTGVMIAFILGNFLFIMIQRYNRPRLMRVKELYERRKNKKMQSSNQEEK